MNQPHQRRDQTQASVLMGEYPPEVAFELSKAFKLKPRLQARLDAMTRSYTRAPNDPIVQQAYQTARNDVNRLNAFLQNPFDPGNARWWYPTPGGGRGTMQYNRYFTREDISDLMYY